MCFITSLKCFCAVLIKLTYRHILVLCFANKDKDWQNQEKDWGEGSDHVLTCAKYALVVCGHGGIRGWWSYTRGVPVRSCDRGEGDKSRSVRAGNIVDPALVPGDPGVDARQSRPGAADTETHNSALHKSVSRLAHYRAPWVSLKKEIDGSCWDQSWE